MTKEDILKEPLTVFFSSMVAFGYNKNPDKEAMVKQNKRLP